MAGVVTLREDAPTAVPAEPDTDDWYAWAPYVAALLDLHDGGTREAHGWRVMKLVEEVGEVADAWIGMVGQNPRKGVYATVDTVVDELADVVATALLAIASLGRDPREVMQAHARKMRNRAPAYRRAAGLE